MIEAVRRLRSTPWAVAVCVLALYVAWVGIAHYDLHRRWSDFAFVGSEFTVARSSESPTIQADGSLATSVGGYDGQFFFYIAQDPAHASPYIDDPGYRYERIAYPILARVLALGRENLIPFMLVAINVLAVALGTLALAVVLRRHRRSPWFALIFALYPGVVVAVQRDLSEALAYSLAACAIALFDRGGRRDLIASTALFALAILTRETTALFVVVCAGVLLFRDRYPKRATLFAVGAVLPYVLYRRFLKLWLGHSGVPSILLPTHTPFAGIAHYWPWDSSMVQQVYAIVIPGVFCLGLAIWMLVRRRFDLAVWALAANAIVFVVLLPYPVFQDIFASARVTTGVVLSFVLAIPVFWTIRPALRLLVVLPVVAWMAPWTTLYQPGWFPYGAASHPAVNALAVSIQGAPRTAVFGQEVNFTVWSTNSSPTTGFGPVVLTIYLPSGLRLVGPPFHERGSGCKGTETLTCNLFSLSPQTGTPVRFGVRLTGASNQTLSVAVSAPGAVTRTASFTVNAG